MASFARQVNMHGRRNIKFYPIETKDIGEITFYGNMIIDNLKNIEF